MLLELTRDQYISYLQAFLTSLDPEILTSKDTDAGVRIEMLADALMGQQLNVRGIEDDLFFQQGNATSEAIELHAEARFGENARKAATITDEIDDALQVTGTISSTVSEGDTLIHADGSRFEVTKTVTLSATTATVNIQSITTGTTANKSTGEELTFETPPSGIQPVATLVKDLTGATDQESDAELTNRILDNIRNPHAGGRASAYRQWALTNYRVKSAYVYCPSSYAATGRRGIGTVDVAILGDGTGSDRIPSSDTAEEVTDYIETQRPAACADFSVLIPDDTEIDFEIEITPDTGYEWDWTTTSSWTVSTWTPGTKKLVWNTTLPSGVVAGVRLCVNGEYCVVDSVGADYTILDRLLEGSIAGGETIYPGGPLTEPIQEAIRDYMDSLGPSKQLWYDHEQTDWEDSVKHSKLLKAIMSVDGVLDSEIVSPATNVSPADPGGGGVPELLIYSPKIIVRPA